MLTLTEEKIITKIRQLSPDAMQKLEEFIDQLFQASDSTEKPHPWLELAGMFKDDIGSQDLKIAAIALTHQMTLVTRNTQDFRQIADLTLENWTT
ncbi:MAG: hypothetical protein ACRC6M_09255 [Microcystaceae cyanobacterium]